MASPGSIARLIAARRVLPEPVVQRLQGESKTRTSFLGAVLRAGVPEPDLVSLLSEELGMPGVDLSRTTIDLDVLDSIPRVVAESDVVLPLSTDGGRLHVAVSGGASEHAVLEELRFITGQEVSPYAALPGPLERAIAAAYDTKERGERYWRGPGLLADADAGVAVVLPGNKPGTLAHPGTDEVLAATQELEELRGDEFAVEVGDDEEGEVEVLHAVQMRTGPARILVVDDDPDILRLLEKALVSAGYQVTQARDGREAEEKLKTSRYDLVLLDAMLPHVHGFEICARLKASARTRSIPVILVSAVYRGWRYAHDAREAFGADDFLEKPFHLPELLRRVQARLTGGPAGAPSDQSEQLYQEGMSLLEAKKLPEARALFERAVKQDAQSPRAHFALGRALHEQGDIFPAITAYEHAVELRPNLFPALRALAALYEQKGFRRKAVEALERAVHASPDRKTREEMRRRLLRLL
ncbi:MAG TPA: response regulator [Myxococcales bacterium]|nr:response regulator [Myxococcales bacterium]